MTTYNTHMALVNGIPTRWVSIGGWCWWMSSDYNVALGYGKQRHWSIERTVFAELARCRQRVRVHRWDAVPVHPYGAEAPRPVISP